MKLIEKLIAKFEMRHIVGNTISDTLNSNFVNYFLKIVITRTPGLDSSDRKQFKCHPSTHWKGLKEHSTSYAVTSFSAESAVKLQRERTRNVICSN